MRILKHTSFLKTSSRRIKKFRRSGGLPLCTHQSGRSMTLRPRLTAGLPFRYTKLAVNIFNCIFKFRRKRLAVTFWLADFLHIKTRTEQKSYKRIAISLIERVIILPYAQAKSGARLFSTLHFTSLWINRHPRIAV